MRACVLLLGFTLATDLLQSTLATQVKSVKGLRQLLTARSAVGGTGALGQDCNKKCGACDKKDNCVRKGPNCCWKKNKTGGNCNGSGDDSCTNDECQGPGCWQSAAPTMAPTHKFSPTSAIGYWAGTSASSLTYSICITASKSSTIYTSETLTDTYTDEDKTDVSIGIKLEGIEEGVEQSATSTYATAQANTISDTLETTESGTACVENTIPCAEGIDTAVLYQWADLQTDDSVSPSETVTTTTGLLVCGSNLYYPACPFEYCQNTEMNGDYDEGCKCCTSDEWTTDTSGVVLCSSLETQSPTGQPTKRF